MPRVLFLPGARGKASFWRLVGDRLPSFPDKYFFAWPGLGDEPHDPRVISINDLVELVLAQMHEPCDLVAQSMGGAIALRAALAPPSKVRRLVLTATSGGIPMDVPGRVDWRPAYRQSFPNAASWITDKSDDLTPRISKIAAPCLLLWGDADDISPVDVGRNLQRFLPRADLHIVPGGDHDLAETHADVIAPLIAAHLT